MFFLTCSIYLFVLTSLSCFIVVWRNCPCDKGNGRLLTGLESDSGQNWDLFTRTETDGCSQSSINSNTGPEKVGCARGLVVSNFHTAGMWTRSGKEHSGWSQSWKRRSSSLRQQLGLLLRGLLYSLLLFSKYILSPSVPLPRMSPLLEYLSLSFLIYNNQCTFLLSVF